MQLTFRKLNVNDDFERVSELIYNVDPYCYRDVFGNLEKAKIVLPVLMNNQKSIFYRDNYYCAEHNKEIVGIVSFFFHFTEWDDAVIEDAFGELGLEIPRSYYKVSKYFKEDYNYYKSVASTCQVSVADQFQNKGIGTFLIRNILDIYGQSDIQLNVSTSNNRGIHLYKKFGFIIVNEHDDYAGEDQPLIKSYLMYRPGSQD